MIISHNIQALNTNRIANTNFHLYGKSLEKVSSGYKINHVGDDPVGLAMSETMRRQIRGLNQGIENTKAAINFCQTADGALSEVTEMLQRLNKLSVQAETATNSDSDRQQIQVEVKQILGEIDRIADTTTFNEIPIFRGTEEVVIPGADGSIIEGDIPFEDFSIADVEVGRYGPFDRDDSGNILKLQAYVNNENPIADGLTYDLIYDSGRTSNSSFRLTYQKQNNDGSTVPKNETIEFGASKLRENEESVYENDEKGLFLLKNKYEAGEDSNSNDYWQRSFLYINEDGVNIIITQKITAVNPDDRTQEKYYNISYSFENMSDSDVTLDFMFNADTAYNDDDNCEGYFINDGRGNGSRLDKWSIFTKPNLPNSFSIIDVDKALAFSEKVSFVQDSKPNAISIGPYGLVDDWGNYDSLDNNADLGPVAGNNPDYPDIAFSLFWNLNIKSKSNSDNKSEISFNYGIISYRKDDNLSNVTINKNPNVIGSHGPHYNKKSLWIQTGSEKGSGLWLEIDEMNTEVLGIDKLDLTTIDGAAKANIQVKSALEKLLTSRGKIGAQQNRLEHTVANEDNISEKVAESESGIRDTDLSSEMIRYSNLSILLKTGQAMIEQVNQKAEKILTVLQ